MLRYLTVLANELDKRGLTKEADYADRLLIKAAGWRDYTPDVYNKADDVETDLTGSAVEEQTASGTEAFRSTLTESDRVTLDRLEASEETEGCKNEHLSSMHDGNAKDSYIEFLNCVHDAADMSPDIAQDAKQLVDALADSGVATEEQAED